MADAKAQNIDLMAALTEYLEKAREDGNTDAIMAVLGTVDGAKAQVEAEIAEKEAAFQTEYKAKREEIKNAAAEEKLLVDAAKAHRDNRLDSLTDELDEIKERARLAGVKIVTRGRPKNQTA